MKGLDLLLIVDCRGRAQAKRCDGVASNDLPSSCVVLDVCPRISNSYGINDIFYRIVLYSIKDINHRHSPFH